MILVLAFCRGSTHLQNGERGQGQLDEGSGTCEGKQELTVPS